MKQRLLTKEDFRIVTKTVNSKLKECKVERRYYLSFFDFKLFVYWETEKNYYSSFDNKNISFKSVDDAKNYIINKIEKINKERRKKIVIETITLK